MVVPETEDFTFNVSHENVVWINKSLGEPKLKERNAKYLAPYWITDDLRGVNRLYHILNISDNEITLGNSFVLDKIWDNMGQYRKFEYKPLKSFNFIELRDGILFPYDFNEE